MNEKMIEINEKIIEITKKKSKHKHWIERQMETNIDFNVFVAEMIRNHS